MLSDFFTRLTSLMSGGHSILPDKGDRKIRVLNCTNGEIEEHDLPDADRGHNVGTIDSIVKQASRYKGDQPSIYVSRCEIVAVFDDQSGTAHGLAGMEIKTSEILSTISNLSGLKPERLIKLMRHNLASAEFVPPDLQQIFATVKFHSATDIESANAVADMAVSKKITGRVTGAGDIPETATIRFSVYPSIEGDVDTTVDVDVSIFTDSAEGTISLTPLPGEIERAINTAVDAVVTHLESLEELKGCTVFNGSH